MVSSEYTPSDVERGSGLNKEKRFLPGAIQKITEAGQSSYIQNSRDKLGWMGQQEEYLNKVRQEVNLKALKKEIDGILGKNSRFSLEGLEAIGCLVARLGYSLLDYDTLVSDEGGGRIPTLILNEIAKNKRAEVGLRGPRVLFVTGGRVGDSGMSPRDWEQGVDRMLQDRENDPNLRMGNTLLISEGSQRAGDTLGSMMKRFQTNEIGADLAVVSAASITSLLGNVSKYGHTFIGSESVVGGQMFLGGEVRTGVTKKIKHLAPEAPEPLVHPARFPNAKIEDIIRERMVSHAIARAMTRLI